VGIFPFAQQNVSWNTICVSSYAAGCVRCKEKSVAQMNFTSTHLNVTNVTLFFSIKLSLTLSHHLTRWREIQCPQGLPRNPMGRPWQRLSGGWKPKAQPRVGARVLPEAGHPHLASSVLRNTTPPPVLGPLRDSGLNHSRSPPITLPGSFPSQDGEHSRD